MAFSQTTKVLILTAAFLVLGGVYFAFQSFGATSFGVTLSGGAPGGTVDLDRGLVGHWTFDGTGSSTPPVDPPQDTSPPVITLIGSNTVTLIVGDSFTDEGASAVDDVDGDISSTIVTDSTVDTLTAGTYTVTYNVTDAAGNTASGIVRSVIVEDVSIVQETSSSTDQTVSAPDTTTGS